jgi:hypothetical protein
MIGNNNTAHEISPMRISTTNVEATPTNMVIWLEKTDFTGNKSTGKIVLVRMARFATIELTAYVMASFVMRNGTSPEKINKTYFTGDRFGARTWKITK